MTLYRVSPTKLEPVAPTTFATENLLERADLQRRLREDISPISDDLLVIAEEFGDWEESARRVDLLCLNKDADLVVVEIKRTEDGGHMELQALRYAAMVSSMTLEQAIQVHTKNHGDDGSLSRKTVLEFLAFDSEEEAKLSGEVRMVLVSSNFSPEITTAVLWLNRRDLDIRCVRLRPYRMGNEVLIDATQIIPLPESAQYEIKLREQSRENRKADDSRKQLFLRFWGQLIERAKPRTSLLKGRTRSDDHWLSTTIGAKGFSLTLSVTRHSNQVECYIRMQGDPEKSFAAFAALREHALVIERTYGGPLEWQELPNRIGCRICDIHDGGSLTPEAEWPALQDAMIDRLIRLDGALRTVVTQLEF